MITTVLGVMPPLRLQDTAGLVALPPGATQRSSSDERSVSKRTGRLSIEPFDERNKAARLYIVHWLADAIEVIPAVQSARTSI